MSEQQVETQRCWMCLGRGTRRLWLSGFGENTRICNNCDGKGTVPILRRPKDE